MPWNKLSSGMNDPKHLSLGEILIAWHTSENTARATQNHLPWISPTARVQWIRCISLEFHGVKNMLLILMHKRHDHNTATRGAYTPL